MKPLFHLGSTTETEWNVPDRYTDLDLIGTGTFGAVCKATDTRTGDKVAIKRNLCHENVLDLLDIFTPDPSADKMKDIYLVSSLMGADLYQILQTQVLSDDHVRFLVYQMLRGLKYIHSAGIIHRDLKPNNIGINEDCELRILDFGMARVKDTRMSGYVAMRWYRAPEIMYNWTSYDKTADVWSVGCIMAEMINQKPFFPGRDQLEQFWRMCTILGTPGPGLIERMKSSSARGYIRSFPDQKPKDFHALFPTASPQARDLLQMMLVWDPEDRVSAERALEHSYFEPYHDPNDEPTTEEIPSVPDCGELTLPEWKERIWDDIHIYQKELQILRRDSDESFRSDGSE